MSRIADAPVAVQEFIVQRLLASAELADALETDPADLGSRIWDSPPDSEAQEPYVIISMSETADVNTIPMVEVMARAEATVKVVGRAEAYETLTPAWTAVHAALQGQRSVPVSGGGVALTCRRLRTVAYPESINGVEYRHLGGTYEVFAQ